VVGCRKTLEEERRDRLEEDGTRHELAEALQHSSFYHIMHQLINPGYQQKDLIFRLYEAATLLALGTMPSWYVLKAGAELRQSFLTEKCSQRLDTCVCMRESVVYADLLEWSAYFQMLLAFAELLSYFLSMPYFGGKVDRLS
jgi:hypothetical protein